MTDAVATVAAALAEPLTSPASRTFAPSLVVAALVAAVIAGWRRGWRPRELLRAAVPVRLLTHPSSRLDVQLVVVRQLLRLTGLVPALGGAWWGAVHVARSLDAALGRPQPIAAPEWALILAYTVVLFVAWDLSRYLLHRAMHEVPALWQLHQVHHSAEVLTPLTFFRVHPVEAVLFELRGSLVTALVAGVWFWAFRGAVGPVTLLGVHALGFAANAATGNLRHSHVWLSFGRVERWLVSPAQHQLHHSADPADFGTNYGTWLALWDRLGGSWRPAGPRRPRAFGIAAVDRNHAPDDLLGALVGPLVAVVRAPARLVTAALLLLPLGARAEPPDDAEASDDDDDDLLVVIVKKDDGVPRVAGSAHVVDEEALLEWRHDDVHEVLRVVPGVYLREEDGYGLRPNIGMRGANSDRSAKTTLLEDGVLFAPAPYAAPAAYYFPMMSRVVGVEVFKGPAATRFGPHTVGGAVNLLTRPVPRQVIAMADLAGGSFGTGRGHAYLGAGGARWGVLLEGAHLGSAGFKELDTGGPTGFSRSDVLAKAAWRSDPDARTRHLVELKLGYGREQSHETYLGLSVADFAENPWRRYAASDRDLMRWARTAASASWQVTRGELVIRTTAYHHHLHRTWEKLNRFAGGPALDALLVADGSGQAGVYQAILRGEEDTASAEQVLQIGTNDRTFDAMGVQSVGRYGSWIGPVHSSLEVGLRAHVDLVDRLHTEKPFAMTGGRLVRVEGPRTTLLDAHSTAFALAGHVHDDLRLGRLWVSPGVRVEAIRTTYADGGVATDPQWRAIALPGIGVLGEVTPVVQLFAGVHRGFSPVAPGSAKETRPEASWNTEAGARLGDADSRAEVVGFFNDYTNLTGQCTFSAGCIDELDAQFNAGAVHVVGVEAVAAHALVLPEDLRLEAEASYTYTHGAFRTSFSSAFPQFGDVDRGDLLPYLPQHQGAARLALAHPRFGMSVGGSARGRMLDVAGAKGDPDVAAVPAAWTVDVATRFVVVDGVELYATVTNLTDNPNLASFRPFGARPTAPRQAMVGVRGALP